ncbi:MAG: TetR/AcrR family transcriptional regulator [Myxococcota bacterium]|nr:TetR/AcrR family transcriptional regulator [Myxococcota bacterium]
MRERVSVALDGRRLRAEQNRARILDAVAEALADPDVAITPAGIAARAGVSISTLVRHFRNRQGLVSALRERIRAQVVPIVQAGPFEGNVEARVDELVRRRSAIFELVAPVYRAAPRDAQSTSWREPRERLERVLQAQLRQALPDELSGDGDTEALLGALLSFASWDHLRTTQAIDAERAHALLARGALALLR